MLQRHCDHMDERARAAGVELATDPFLFSLVADCSKPMPQTGRQGGPGRVGVPPTAPHEHIRY